MSPKRVKAAMESNNVVDIDSPEYKTDEFRMYSLKVIECSRRYSHDWTTCPFAHPQEKARRRDPRRFHYTGMACPYIKQEDQCPLRDDCPYAHNVFEYWLHPTRYRTQLCNIAASCNRTVCFFAHNIEELRVPVFADSPAPGAVLNRGGLSQLSPSLNPITCSLVDVPGAGGTWNPAATGASFDVQALGIVEQLVASRRLSAQIRQQSNAPASDVNDVQTLISLLQQQQTLAGISSESTNSDIELSFLTAMFQALSRVVSAVVMQQTERERLTKLINWMYVQLVRNRQSLFSTSDSFSLFSPNRTDMPQGVLMQPLDDTLAGHQQQQQQSLSRIPELSVASSALFPSIPVGIPTSPERTIPLGSHMTFIPGLESGSQQRLSAQWLRGSSLDFRPPPSSFFGLGAYGSALRHSDESSGTRLSSGARNSNSLSINRSSADTDNFMNRRHDGITSQDSQRMSYDDSNTVPDFVFHEWSTATQRTRLPLSTAATTTTTPLNAPPPPPHP